MAHLRDSDRGIPFPMHTPDSCTFVVGASIGHGGSGSVTVLLRGDSD